jgi:putative chitinase
MITRDDLRKFAPRAKSAYVDALLAGMETLREAGILDNEHRLCHFMAQVGHETGGFTIVRESMAYTPKRMRQVWPGRYRNKSDAELRRILSSPQSFGDDVYGRRMGNNRPGDGYAFRGAGFIQTTGRSAFTKYAEALGLPTDDMSLGRYADDLGILLKFACLEWKQSGCNDWSDENDLTKVCKAINTGSATSNIKPVGMADRQRWFAKAWSIWGERGTPDVPAEPTSQAVPAAAAVGGTAIGGAVLADPVGLSSSLVAVKSNASQLLSGVDIALWSVPVVLGVAAVAFIWWARKP